jgi:ribosomal protein L11 methylase PrmA
MPTHADLVQAVMKLAAIKPSDRVVDLGSGDGRLVLAAAKQGAKEAVGYEIDGWNVIRARREAKRMGITTARFKTESFWKASLRDVDVVLVYGLPPYMNRLAEKCRTELRPGARIVSLMYELPGWKASQSLQNIHLYTV